MSFSIKPLAALLVMTVVFTGCSSDGYNLNGREEELAYLDRAEAEKAEGESEHEAVSSSIEEKKTADTKTQQLEQLRLEEEGYSVDYETISESEYGKYQAITVYGLTPSVYAPDGAGSGDLSGIMEVTEMVEKVGEEKNIILAINSGIFYDTQSSDAYCYHGNDPDGVIIADGVVLKSAETVDHSECDILVIDEAGSVGWADYYADADALAAGESYYYDIYGEKLNGRKIRSAVTGFVPILVGGINLYDANDGDLHGYDNYVAHYTVKARRQIFGVKADGGYVILSSVADWTLSDAAKAAIEQGCIFAYNLDGGTSTETVLAVKDENGYTVNQLSRMQGLNKIPAYIVFTSDNSIPVSAVPRELEVKGVESEGYAAGTTLEEIAAGLSVYEILDNDNGRTSKRRVYSKQIISAENIEHKIVGGYGSMKDAKLKKSSYSPAGTLNYTKTPADEKFCLSHHGNTRSDGKYYDYSTGYTISSDDDLSTPGEKTLHISYRPGADRDELKVDVNIIIK
ncbi:MAG: phosphodiester glycosidase family protein [Lachnospiraceae bacterium]|nr:phosphodiester glycosidase family protein [Lachnospiraceae bacterium]